MKATLYMQDQKDPVAILDEIQIVKMNDNHQKTPYRTPISDETSLAQRRNTEDASI